MLYKLSIWCLKTTIFLFNCENLILDTSFWSKLDILSWILVTYKLNLNTELCTAVSSPLLLS